MSEKEKWYRTRGWRVAVVTVAMGVIGVCLPSVANAYGLHLAMMPAPMPGQGVTFSSVGPAVVNQNAAVPLHSSMLANMGATALHTPTRALWNMYPASVRGRVFGGNGGDPLSASPSPSGGGW